MLAYRLIERKRDGGRIEPAEWQELIGAYLRHDVSDAQMAALMMAVFFRGLDREEVSAFTEAMWRSGATLDLAHLDGPRIDKHSTGGVGDKVSLVLAPLVASLGIAVPMMSGRGLGHTGGTLDKLESIAGFRTQLSLAEARAQVERVGCALIGQSEEIAPADRRLYALRDATATVAGIPLIAASIMSKKLAEGLTGLVLDIKRGLRLPARARARGLELAHLMVALGRQHGMPVVALVTAMDRPRPGVRQRYRGGGGDSGPARRRPARPDARYVRVRCRDAGAGRRGAQRRRRTPADGSGHFVGAGGGEVPGGHRGAGVIRGGGRPGKAAPVGGV